MRRILMVSVLAIASLVLVDTVSAQWPGQPGFNGQNGTGANRGAPVIRGGSQGGGGFRGYASSQGIHRTPYQRLSQQRRRPQHYVNRPHSQQRRPQYIDGQKCRDSHGRKCVARHQRDRHGNVFIALIPVNTQSRQCYSPKSGNYSQQNSRNVPIVEAPMEQAPPVERAPRYEVTTTPQPEYSAPPEQAAPKKAKKRQIITKAAKKPCKYGCVTNIYNTIIMGRDAFDKGVKIDQGGPNGNHIAVGTALSDDMIKELDQSPKSYPAPKAAPRSVPMPIPRPKIDRGSDNGPAQSAPPGVTLMSNDL